jgi:hypothetical protein
VVKPLPSGSYTFKIWIRHSQSLRAEYIFAKGYSAAELAASMKLDTTASNDMNQYAQIVLEHIPVTSGKCEVGLHTEGGPDNKANWSSADEAEFVLEAPSGG